MDKRDIKEKIKLISKIYLLMIIVTALPITIVASIIAGIINGNIIELLISNIVSLIKIILYFGIIIYSIMGIVYLLTKINRKKEILQANSYTRELPEYFPPAIASLLLDLSVETTTDYTATIAYLISKKYIKISENNEEIELISSNQLFNSEHEKYVFECVTKQRKFNHNEFRKLIVKDAKKMKLVGEGKRKIHFIRNFVLAIIFALIFSFAIEYTDGLLNILCTILGVMSSFSIFGVIGYSLYLLKKYENENIYRTLSGKIESRKWSGLKKYLHDYTLISDRNLNDIEIFDEYIPYAIALGEAKSIEKYIENNNEYRKLIYGNIVNGGI